MLNENYLLGIDIGTTFTKSLLINEEGKVIASSSKGYELLTPKENFCEQRPLDWWNSVKSTVQEVTSKIKNKNSIKALGLSAQMHSLVVLDKNKEVLRNAILWNDGRSSKESKDIVDQAGGINELLKLTNNNMLNGYTGSKIIWLKNNEPETYEKIHKVLNTKDYIRFMLSDCFATEVSDASGTGLFDVRNRVWSKELIDKLGINFDILPTCYESSVISSHILDNIADELNLPRNLPIIGGGGDAVIQTLGSGVVTSDTLQTTIGTAGISAMVSPVFLENKNEALQVFCDINPTSWHIMGVSMCSGVALEWFKNTISNKNLSYDELLSSLSKSKVGANGVFFLPYLLGERCPHNDFNAKGSFIGLSLSSTQEDMLRALLESTVYALKDMADCMPKELEIKNIIASGGGSKNPLWRSIQADVFKSDVYMCEGAQHGGAYGAALLAGIGVNIYKDTKECASLIKKIDKIAFNENNHIIYNKLHKVYQGLYQDLKTSFSNIAEVKKIL